MPVTFFIVVFLCWLDKIDLKAKPERKAAVITNAKYDVFFIWFEYLSLMKSYITVIMLAL